MNLLLLCVYGLYVILLGKSVPIVKGREATKMEEGEIFAIETFGSINGRGVVVEDMECSHYMINTDAGHVALRTKKAKQVLRYIHTYRHISFCRHGVDSKVHESY